MANNERVIKPNKWMMLGSIAFGALGAFTIDFFKRSQAQCVSQQPQSFKLGTQKSLMDLDEQQQEKITKTVYKKLKFSRDDPNTLIRELKYLEDITCEIERVPNLIYDLEISEFPVQVNPMLGNSKYRSVFGGEGFLPEGSFITSDCFILQRAHFGPNESISRTKRWLRAGPRKHIFYNHEDVKAAIVTCGGLCPGMNVVLRELVMTLQFNYKVTKIYGIKDGFNGIYEDEWIELTPQLVKDIHRKGGTYLGTSRYKFDAGHIIDVLAKRGINQLYVLGGEGTLKCVYYLSQKIRQKKLRIAVCAIPKSIENDIPIIDKSFGFESAIEVAQTAIESAYNEAHSRKQCVGIVRLIGRNTGYLSMCSSIAARHVNICLVPEFQIDLFGQQGLLEYVYQRLNLKGSCTIVVSEGCIQSVRDFEVKEIGKDASGNTKYSDIGEIIKEQIKKYCIDKGFEPEVKYINPQYMVRAGRANAHDTKMCTQLAQNAVHGEMAGFTGFAIGHVSSKTCFIPLEEMCSGNYSNRIQLGNIEWQRLLASTGQPSFSNDLAE